MRLPRVVASAALIALLASVVVPGASGARIPSAPGVIDPSAFATVDVGRQWTAMTTPQLDPAGLSAGHLEPDAFLGEAQTSPADDAAPRPAVHVPTSVPIIQGAWHLDNNISWYGPGFYGHNGACGLVPGGIQADTIGVAHRTLPCGTRVTFRYNGRTVTTIVIDRGPYVSGRIWDMTHGLCAALQHCFTGGGVVLAPRLGELRRARARGLSSLAWTAGERSSSRSGSTRSSRSGSRRSSSARRRSRRPGTTCSTSTPTTS